MQVDQECFEHGKNDILVGSSGLDGAHATAASAGGPFGAGHPTLPCLPAVTASLASAADGRAGGVPFKAPSAVDVRPLAERRQEGGQEEGQREGCTLVDTWLDRKYYSCPGAARFRVRGPNYLKDRCGASCTALSMFWLNCPRKETLGLFFRSGLCDGTIQRAGAVRALGRRKVQYSSFVGPVFRMRHPANRSVCGPVYHCACRGHVGSTSDGSTEHLRIVGGGCLHVPPYLRNRKTASGRSIQQADRFTNLPPTTLMHAGNGGAYRALRHAPPFP